MQLSVKALALASGTLFALAMFLTGLLALLIPEWGEHFMTTASAFYPGIGGLSFGNVIVGTVYALIDGLVGGGLLAWLYNRFLGSAGSGAPAG